MRDLRNLYVRGKHAIIPNLPRPPVSLLGDHGYVCLKDCVADMLGHNVVNTPCKLDIVLSLYITEWSDIFEPSSCKKKRGSYWIKTVTLAPPPSQVHKLTHTYPIVIGLYGDSYEEVEERFAAAIREFSTGSKVMICHGGIEKDIIVYL
jgi:hypothetical protein